MIENYGGYMIDLDGTMYRGKEKIPAAKRFVERLQEKQIPFLFVTNNTTKTPEDVAKNLTENHDIKVKPENVYTAALATADYLDGIANKDHRKVYIIGEIGLKRAILAKGFEMEEDHPDYVVAGLDYDVTYHKFEDKLKCHYCGYERPNYKLCPKCGSNYIRYFGGGTQKVEDELNRLFPNATTVRMDMDTTGKKQSHEKILQKFEKDKIDILIGTQMVAKGLDFENVTLVGVITADTMLNINDYRSGERTFAMLEQVSGRAGRGSKEGRAVIQTYTPEHEAVSLVKSHNYRTFYDKEIAKRKLMWYPPFCKIVSVHFQGNVENIVAKTAKYFLNTAEKTQNISQKIQVLGPVPSYISKIKNKYRWQIIFKCEDDDNLGEILSQAEMTCRKNKEFSDVAIIIDKSPGMIN